MAEAMCPSRAPRMWAWSSTIIWTSRAKWERSFVTWARRTFLKPATPTSLNSQLKTLNSESALSTHAPEQAQRATEAGADYIAIALSSPPAPSRRPNRSRSIMCVGRRKM